MEAQKFTFNFISTTELLLGGNIFSEVVTRLARMRLTKRCLVVTNEVVAKWYLQPLMAELRERRFETTEIVLPDGEVHKTLETAQRLFQPMLEGELDRKSIVIGLGGGVIGDLAGFAAGIFKRGIPFVFFPTTLLAMVDSCIGGKTGVNIQQGKNLLGSFSQPMMVGIDVATLRTLPLTQLTYGLVEAVKHGALADPAYFKFLLRNRDAIKARDLELLKRLVRRSLNIKRAFVEADEREEGIRAQLNLGHTIGHALEVLGEYRRYHHGEAVGLGMLIALKISRFLGILKEDYSEGLREFLADLALPTAPPEQWTPEKIAAIIIQDKKRRQEKIQLVLPVMLGKVVMHGIPVNDLSEILTAVLRTT